MKQPFFVSGGGLLLLVVSLQAAPNVSPVAVPTHPLQWDAETKEITVSPGALKTNFKFWFTNTSPAEVQIQSAQSSCFCTVATLPSVPWLIPPGTNGAIDVTMDLAGKSGSVSKPVNVMTSAGLKTLLVRVNIPTGTAAAFPVAMADTDRIRNAQAAVNDRQVVFKKAECAECHAKPALGRAHGAEIYTGVCGICHDSIHRASTVPDLNIASRGKDLDYWRNWITHGRPGTMMPAFAQAEGGPLTDAQIDSLARHLAESVSVGSPARAQTQPSLIHETLAVSNSVSVFPLPTSANR